MLVYKTAVQQFNATRNVANLLYPQHVFLNSSPVLPVWMNIPGIIKEQAEIRHRNVSQTELYSNTIHLVTFIE
jgi:hypothetical protein